MLVLRVDSLADTHAVAAAVAALSRTGDIIVLAGEMGAGKTAFAQGFGRALGITEPITSPTFTLVHSYPFGHRRTLHHADLYRLDTTSDVADLALDELAEFGGVVLVEWGDVAAATFGDHLEIRIEHDDDLDDTPDDDLDNTPDDTPDDDVIDDPPDQDATDDRDDRAARDDADRADDAGEYGDGPRLIEIAAAGQSWAGRWERLTTALAPYRI